MGRKRCFEGFEGGLRDVGNFLNFFQQENSCAEMKRKDERGVKEKKEKEKKTFREKKNEEIHQMT